MSGVKTAPTKPVKEAAECGCDDTEQQRDTRGDYAKKEIIKNKIRASLGIKNPLVMVGEENIDEARAEEKRGLGSTGAQRQRQKTGVLTSSGQVVNPATSYSGGQNPHLRGKKDRTKEQRRQASRRYVDQPGGVYGGPENKQGAGRYAAMQAKKRPDLGSRFD